MIFSGDCESLFVAWFVFMLLYFLLCFAFTIVHWFGHNCSSFNLLPCRLWIQSTYQWYFLMMIMMTIIKMHDEYSDPFDWVIRWLVKIEMIKKMLLFFLIFCLLFVIFFFVGNNFHHNEYQVTCKRLMSCRLWIFINMTMMMRNISKRERKKNSLIFPKWTRKYWELITRFPWQPMLQVNSETWIQIRGKIDKTKFSSSLSS